MDPTAVPDPNDLGRQPTILGVTWAFTAVVIVIVAGRVYVRARILHGLLSDDWLMLVATAGQIAFQVCLTKSLQWGLGKHDKDLTFDQLVNILKWVWLSTIPGLLGTLFARASVAVLLIRLFGNKRWLKWYLIIWTTFQSLATIALLIVIFVQCSPVEGLWNPAIEARRWDPNIELYLAFFSQSTLTFSDLTYVLFPVLIIWRLNMPTRRKVALSALLSLSLFTMTASILKTITAETSHGSQNAEYVASLSALWAAIEQSFVIIMGSIPPLRPLASAEWPRLRSLRRSLSGMVTRSTTTSPGGKQSGLNSPDPRSAYYNLDTMNSRRTGRSPGSQSDKHNYYQGPTIEHVKGGDNSIDDGRIRRTDHFSLEYSKYLGPDHDV
ncbi:hypothetical protein F4777DRAFT_468440 [Nemania sp. FL0916]|nr:hypothetical protein F4777DRAFT_468440 [Nemania sp. FL0916]